MKILPIDSGRYGSKRITSIFEEDSRFSYQLKVEGVVAKAQSELGVIPKEAGEEIYQTSLSGKVTSSRWKTIEKTLKHETAALVEALAEVCSEKSKPWVHYGLTSNDILDTATSLQLKDALMILEGEIRSLNNTLISRATQYRNLPAVARTHGQHAGVISFGLKFAVYSNQLIEHLTRLNQIRERILLCKSLGPVGTGSVMGIKALAVQLKASEKLGLRPVKAATQVIDREIYAELLSYLALVGSTLEKIAVEIRNLQRTEIGEVEEPFSEGQVGSSALPMKKNPIECEKVSSLARMLRSYVAVSLENVAMWHERDLSNSANERFTIPSAVILIEEMLTTLKKTINGLTINEEVIKVNLEKTKGRILSEFVLDHLLRKGVSRTLAYRIVQKAAFQSAKSNSRFRDEILQNRELRKYISKHDADRIFTYSNHLGASLKIIDSVRRLAREI